jgi:hypothetical protein
VAGNESALVTRFLFFGNGKEVRVRAKQSPDKKQQIGKKP